MKAIVQKTYGSPDLLEFVDVHEPVVGADDVLVRVRAASVHPGDVIAVTGVPYLARLAFGLRRPKSPIPGRDLAGTVEATGRNVTSLRAGDEVFGWSTTGVLAENACAPAGNFVTKPANLSFEQAAAVTVSATTALQALRKGDVGSGTEALIVGASGGVGHYAVQIAKRMGADVTGVCSTRNVDMVRSLGADHVFDYTREDFAGSGRRFGFILDNVADHSLTELRRILRPGGVLVSNNGTTGGRVFGTVGRTLKGLALFAFAKESLRPFVSKQNQEDLVALKALVESGGLMPVIDRTYPLSDAAEALRYVGEGHARGKVVVTL